MDKETKPRYRIEYICSSLMLSRFIFDSKGERYFQNFKDKHFAKVVSYGDYENIHQFVTKIS